jgi:hypothetical protein
MRKISLVITLILIAQLFFGQNKLNSDNITYGKDYQGFSGTIKKYITVDNILLSVCFYRETIILQTFNKNTLKIIGSKDFNGFPKKVIVEDVLIFNNEVYLFYSTLIHDNSVFQEKLYRRKINIDSCSFEKSKLLMTVEGNVIGGLYGRENTDNFSFKTSIDKRKLLIQYQRKSKKKKIAEIGYKLFDKEFKLIWEKEMKMPYENWRMENIDFTLDNENNIYLASFIYRIKPGFDILAAYKTEMSERVTSGGKINYDLVIFKFGANSGSFTKSKITLDFGSHINSFKFFRIDYKQLIGAGYSSIIGKNSKFYQTSGAFKFNLLDRNKRIDIFSFPEAIVNQHLKQKKITSNISMKRRYKNEWKSPIENLVPVNLTIEKDGSFILIGEQQEHAISHAVFPTPIGIVHKTTEKMLFNDILISKFNDNGSLAWMKKLAKRQVTNFGVDFFGLDKKGLSFKMIEGKEDLYILYKDQLKNLKLPLTKKPARFNNDDYGMLMAYKINRITGEGGKALIIDVQRINGLSTLDFNLSGISQLRKDQFVFEGFYKNKDILGFLTLVNLK